MDILSSAVVFAAIPAGNEILNGVESEIIHSGTFFTAHAGEIVQAVAGVLVTVAAGMVLYWAGERIFANTVPSRKNWKSAVLGAIFLPGIVLAAEISVLISALPLIRCLSQSAGNLILKFAGALAAATVAWGSWRIACLIDRMIRGFAERKDNSLDNLTAGIIGSSLKILIILTALLFIGQNIFELNISALLASAGVVGLACALAAKDTISNFFGTLVIVADSPFKLGDRIECGNVCGIVKKVGMRSSRIVTDDESSCTIPNSMLTNAVLFQRNRRGHLKRIIDLGVTYDTDGGKMTQALNILHQIMDDFHGKDLPGFEPRIFFAGFGEYALNIRAIIFFKTESFTEEEKLLGELNMLILQRFNAAGIEFAFPTRTVLLENSAP